MKPGEEELQKNMEAGHRSEGLDARAYGEVFRALKKEPDYQLADNFADRVVTRILTEKTRYSRDYFWFGAGLFFLIVAFVATVFFTGFRLDFGFLNGMADYKGLVVFGIFFIVLLNWLDKKLIKGKNVRA